MAFGLSSGAISMIGAGAGLVGSMMQSDAAGDAAGVQAQAGREAAALQQKQYEQTRADLAPYRDTGSLANNRLAQLLGLGSSTQGAFTPKTADQFRQELIGQYTKSTPGGRELLRVIPGASDNGNEEIWGDAQATSSVDEAGLQSAIQRAMAGQGPATAGGQIDDFGMLLKKYTGQDLVNDPGYQFRVSEGQKGVERSAAGRGGLFSGQAGKELERFRQGLASTEFGNAFNRDQAYKGQVYGMLSGTSGAGQNAANMTGTAGANAASGAGNYLTQAANADASGIVGGANAINSGIGNFQNYNMLNSLFNKTQMGGMDSSYIPMQPGGGY